jgi:hypothetical protein
MFHLYPVVKFTEHISFKDLFYAKAVVGPEVYVARDSTVVHGSQSDSYDGQPGSSDQSLTQASWQRIDGYLCLAMQKGLIKDDGSWEGPTALANLKQSASYSNAIVVNDVPALTKTIMLYDLVSNTLLG